MLVGSILIAGATSLPELSIDINAVKMGAVDLAAGDLLGSSLFNLLILATLDLTRYSHGRMLSKQSAGHALAAGMSILLTAIVAIFIILGEKAGSLVIGGIGLSSFILTAAYLFGLRLIFRGKIFQSAIDVRRDARRASMGCVNFPCEA